MRRSRNIKLRSALRSTRFKNVSAVHERNRHSGNTRGWEQWRTPCFAPGFYSYPRDLELIKKRIENVSTDKIQLSATLEEQGFHIPDDAKFIPIYSHPYLMCSPSIESSPVLSIWKRSDAIVYGRSLLEYLEKEVLSEG